MLRFRESDHKYEDIEPSGRIWSSVTSTISKYESSQFDPIAASEQYVADYRNKFYGMDPAIVRHIWKEENERAVKLGKWYHWQRELQDAEYNVCPVRGEWKYALPQQLEEGIYPEFIVYDTRFNICGQIDRLVVKDGKIFLLDYKSNKELKTYSKFFMQPPIQGIVDCKFNHYSLQLSMYATMLLHHNPHLKLGGLEIEHVRFKVVSRDNFGYPLHWKDEMGNYKVESTTKIPIVYMQKEAMQLMTHNLLMRKVEQEKKEVNS